VESSYVNRLFEATSKGVFYTRRLAGPDAIEINWGNAEGIVGGDPRRAGRPHSVLKTPDYLYSHDHDAVFMRQYAPGEEEERIPSLRALGISFHLPYDEPERTIYDILLADMDDRPAVERGADGTYRVEARTPHGTIVWTIDPQRDWSATHVALVRDGQAVQEARMQLERFDGHWFPRRTEIYKRSYQNGEVPVQVVEVLYAEFNRPEHPQRFTPADIGIEPGFLIEPTATHPLREPLIWDSAQAVTLERFDEMVEQGLVERGPNNRAALAALPEATPEQIAEAIAAGQIRLPNSAGGTAGADPVRKRLSQWETYTRNFILRYRLEERQTRKAWQLLGRCQEQAWRYVRARRAAFEKIGVRVATGSASRPSKPVDRAGAALASDATESLLAPIDKIFRERLQPGLEHLPTPAQRRRAQQAGRVKVRSP